MATRPILSADPTPHPGSGPEIGTSAESRANCLLCHGTGRWAFAKNGFHYFSCSACGSLFVHPSPAEEVLAAYYRDLSGEQNSRVCWENSSLHAHAMWAGALDEAIRLAGPGRLLDVGCGAGQFLEFAAGRGWSDLEGIELSPLAAARARKASGATIHEVEFAAARLETGSFSAISLWDVFEHLRDPRAAIRRSFELLRPGGVLMIGTPNRFGISVRALGKRSFFAIPPEHLLLASRRGLRGSLIAEGFDVAHLSSVEVQIRDWARFLPRRSGHILGQSSMPPREGLEPPPGALDQGHADLYARITGSQAFGAVHASANAVLRLTTLGDQLVAVAHKPDAGAGAPGPRLPPGR